MNRLTAAALAATIATLSADARADDASAAFSSFQQGLERTKAGATAQACSAFAEAYRLDQKLGYAVNLARCESKLGHYVLAERHWRDAKSIAERAQDERLAEVTRGHEAALRDVPRLEVQASDPVTVDGQPITAEGLRAGVAVDPGRHRIVVRTPEPTSYDVDVRAAGERVRFVVPRPAIIARTTPAPNPTTPRAEPLRTAAIAFGSAGIVAGGLGIFGALRASSQNSESKDLCPNNRCTTDRGLELRSGASASADLATGAFIVSGALLASSVVLWLVAPGRHPETTAYVAPRGAGAVVGATF